MSIIDERPRSDGLGPTEIASLCRPVFESNGIRRARLFGSRARRDASPDSDVDICINIDTDSAGGIAWLARLVRRLEEALGAPVDLTMTPRHPSQTQEILLKEIERDGITIYERSEK